MYNHNKLQSRCCNNCQSASSEFKQAVNLKRSGLTIYIHKDQLKPKRIGDDDRRSIILYNTADRELKRFDYIVELCRYKTKCLRCTAIIQRVRNLLEDITSINKHQILGICEYCKRPNMRNKCKRCEYIVNKFINNKVQESKDHEERFMIWLLEVQRILISIMQGQVICKHNILLDYESKMQLDNILQYVKSSLPVKQPNIEIYPDRICLQSSENKIDTRKQILDELLSKLKSDKKIDVNIEQIFNNSLSESGSSCICKHLKNDKSKNTLTPLFETLSVKDSVHKIPLKPIEEDKTIYNDGKLQIKEYESQKEKKEVAIKQKRYITKDLTDKAQLKEKKDELVKKQNKYVIGDQIDKENQPDNKNHKSDDQTDEKRKLTSQQQALSIVHDNKKVKEVKDKKEDSFYQLMLQMIKDQKKKPKEKYKKQENQKVIKMPVIGDLPIIKSGIKATIDREDSGSTIKCSSTFEQKITEMIKGNKIVRYNSHSRDNKMKTPLFQVLADCTTPIVKSNQSLLEDNTIPTKLEWGGAGVISYKLSDHKFIEKGWTQMPTTKIMRRMSIYKMIPCNDEYDWFKSHMEQKILFYESGGKLAEVFENGCGKWFYENGEIALDYYNATEPVTSGKRYIIYSSSEDNNVMHKKKQTTVLGCFDSLGNGVVYDHCGNARLKYNQSEGLVIDKTIGPCVRWKWHALNEPPVVYPVYLDTKVKADVCLKDFVDNTDSHTKASECNTDFHKVQDEKMIAIEFENSLKEKAAKMLQKYKPLEMRMKALKLNYNFSLRIINQSKIYLLFRCGRNYFKQNMGMILKSDEIIDFKVIEFGDVTTPYDRKLPKTESINAIQNVLMKAKRGIKH